jgi:gliding motility-associated-like protein
MVIYGKLSAQSFVNGELIYKSKHPGKFYDCHIKVPPKIQGYHPEMNFETNLKIQGLDTLGHEFCTGFSISPNLTVFNNQNYQDTTVGIELLFNGHNDADFGFSLALNAPLIKDSIYEINFLVSSRGNESRQYFYDKLRQPHEEFSIYITESSSPNFQQDTICIIKRSDVYEMRKNDLFPPSLENQDSLDGHYYQVRKTFVAKGRGKYLTFFGHLTITDSVSRIFKKNFKPDTKFFFPAALLNYGLITTGFRLKCPYKILKSGDLCSVENPLTLSCSSVHGMDKLTWSTGEESKSITIKNPGLYWVEKNRNGCVSRDSIYVDSVNQKIFSNTFLSKCKDSSLLIGQVVDNVWNDYKWQNGTANHLFKASEPGTFWRTSRFNGCFIIDTFIVGDYPLHESTKSLNYTLCQYDSISISSSAPIHEWYRNGLLWSDSKFVNIISNSDEFIILKSKVNCWQIDTIRIFVDTCDYQFSSNIHIPDIFTPNGDGVNDVFNVFCISCVTRSIKIYNRWGECIYQGVEPWDGNFCGVPVVNGFYAYMITLDMQRGENSRCKTFSGGLQVWR